MLRFRVTSELFLHPIFSDSRAGPVSRPSLPATLSQGFRAYVTATELHFGRLLFPRQLVANLEENPNEETRFRRRCRRSRHRFCLARARGRRSANDQECLREGPHEVGRDHQDLFEGQHVALLGC